MKGKLLLSVATAALIVTGFTGCDAGKSEDTTTSAVVNTIEQTQYATTIKGVVLDDAGNPVANAKVYVGSKEATTNAGGQYEISGVDVSGYITVLNGNPVVNTNVANAITVSILPPADSDMVSAVVTVTPQMIHIENSGALDGSNVTTTGDINTQPESQSFTILAETQTAVLPHKAAKIEATIRDARTGQPVPAGTKVTAVWKSLSTNAVVVNQNETVGVNSVVGYVDENGTVKLEGLLTSSNYNFVVEGYAASNTNVEVNGDTTGNNVDGTLTGLSFNTLNVTNYADKDYITDLGNILVTPINGEDTIAPTLAFDTNANGVGDNIFAYLNVPLEDGTTIGMVYAPGIDGSADNPLIVNFTEPLQNTITTNDVIVYDVTNKVVIPVSQINLTNGGQTLEIVTAEPIAPNTQLQIRLNRVDFRDLANNILQDSAAAADIYSGPSNSYVALNASTYFQVNMNLSDITDLKEDNATAVDFTGNGYNNKALSTVADVTPGTIPTTLYQMNDNANPALLNALATAVNGSIAVTVNTNYARVSFTPDANVSTYYAILVDQNDNPVATATIYQEDAITALPIKAVGGTNYYDLTDAAGILHNSFIVSDAALASGYKVKVYPVNEFGDLGNPATITLQDNVPLTTVLNNVNSAVDLLGATTGGNSGDLIDIQNASGTGLPILKVTPEMLKTSASAANSDLQTTLTGTDGIYDANDYANFNKARTIGIAVSEPVSSDDVITDYLKVLEANGSVVSNYVNSAQFVDLGGNNYAIAFGINNIIDLQKYAKVTIEGIHDKAGNAADAMAADKIVDGLPPMVVSATATQNQLEIDFTEPISLTDNTGAGYTFTLNDNTGVVYTFTTTANNTVSVTRNTTYTDEYGNTVTNTDPAIELKVVSDGSNGKLILELPTDYKNAAGNTVDLSNYFALVHGKKDSNGADNQVAAGASILEYTNVNDVAKNSWATVATTLTTLPTQFAVVDSIAPKVAPTGAVINPNAAADAQLKLAITDAAGNTLNTTSAANDGNWQVGDNTVGEQYVVQIKFREPIADSNLNLFSSNADFTLTVANTATQYSAIVTNNSKFEVVDPNTIKVKFRLEAGTVNAGDTLQITGIKDANGNETNVTISLQSAGNGITVNESAYK